jgi:two-component system OmpR family sensor kinase
MSRIPIRLRLTLAFTLALAIVLAATGAFLYLRLGSSLDEAIDEGLRARAAELAPRVARGDTRLGDDIGAGLLDPDERFVQVLDLEGRVVGGTAQVGDDGVLDQAALAQVSLSRAAWFEVDDVRGIAGRARVLATAVESSSGTVVLLVGASLEDRDETTHGFLVVLFVVGPAALVLVSFLGYALATAALRPVESMRAEAAVISAFEPGRRLPLPDSRDEVYRLGETLNRMLERLESALERERSFVADASHELRTPLALLKTELELALRRPRSEAELEHALRSAASEADRLVQLAEDLLVLARSDQGRLPMRSEPVSARDLLSRVAGRYGHEAAASGRAIEVESADGLGLPGDTGRLEQALANLVENALRHAAGDIRILAVEHDDRIELHVLDRGSGFPPDFLPHAFERFSRADDARSGNAAGLGLTIADAIARAHGGTAHAENREPGGADVWLSLPAA